MKSNKFIATILVLVVMLNLLSVALPYGMANASAITNLNATVSNNSVQLSWSATNTGSNVIGYYAFRSSTSGNYGNTPLSDFPVFTGFQDNNVFTGQRYYYIVKPVYSDYTYGPASNEVSVTVNSNSSSSVSKIELRVGDPYMYVDGVSREIDPGKSTSPIIVSDRVMLPIRSLIETVGGNVSWIDSERKAIIRISGTEIQLTIGSTAIKVLKNGSEQTQYMDVAPLIENSRTYLPLRFVIENLGYRVEWDPSRKVTIYVGQNSNQSNSNNNSNSNNSGSSNNSGGFNNSYGSSSGNTTGSNNNSGSSSTNLYAPVMDPIGKKYVVQGTTLQFYVSASDFDGNALTFNADTVPQGSEFVSSTGRFTYTPSSSANGVVNARFSVSDGINSDFEDVEIRVISPNSVQFNHAPEIAPIYNRYVQSGQTISFNVNATDVDGDNIAYGYENTPSGANFDTTTGKFTWTPNVQSGNYYFKVKASDGTLTDTEEVLISVVSSNRAPVLSIIGDKTVYENDNLEFTLSASDNENNTITYSSGTLPTGAEFNSNTRTFTWTPTYTQSGVYRVLFRASDGNLLDSEEITIHVQNRNRAPIMNAIGNKTSTVGQKIEFTVSATDPDGDSLEFSLDGGSNATHAVSLPSEATFDSTTKTFSWTPTSSDVGTYTVEFIVSDGNMSDREQVTITVGAGNRPPVLQAIGNKNVNEGSPLQFTISATDPDNDPLTYYATGTPSGANFNPDTRTFSWTPNYSNSGPHTVTFSVSDGTLSDSETITINVTNVNRAPQFDPIPNKSGTVGSLVRFTVNATDPDNDTLTYSLLEKPQGANFNPNTRVFTWTPSSNQARAFTVKFRVSDGTLTDEETSTITVQQNNRAPEFDIINNFEIAENNLLAFTVNATDPDGDNLAYSISDNPSGSTFNSSTRRFSWTPSYNDAGNYRVKFKVSDGQAEDEIYVNIKVIDVNRAPVIASIPQKTITTGQLLTFKVTATDADNDQLTFDVTNKPTNATFNTSTGNFSWKPTSNQTGSRSLTFSVSDGKASDSTTVIIKVNQANRPPKFFSINDIVIDEGSKINFAINANDPDGDNLTYSVITKPNGSTFTASNKRFDWQTNYSSAGNYTVKFKVTDGSEDDELTVNIRVRDVNRAPKFDPVANKTVKEGESLSFIVNATDEDGDSLSYSISDKPSGANFDPSTRRFTWTPNRNQAGRHTVKFSVTDGKATTHMSVEIVVKDSGYNGNMIITGDNMLDVYVNGSKVINNQGPDWPTAKKANVKFVEGKNVIAAKVKDLHVVGGLLADITVQNQTIVTDRTWKVTPNYSNGWSEVNFTENGWQRATEYGKYNDPSYIWYQVQKMNSFPNDTNAKWIWHTDNRRISANSPRDAYFRYTFYIENGKVKMPELNQAAVNIGSIIRDFKDSHPDFENVPIFVEKGLVKDILPQNQVPQFSGKKTSSISNASTFSQWYTDVPNVNKQELHSLHLTKNAEGNYEYINNSFYPIDNQLFGNEGRNHNYHKTLEIHTEFTYKGGEVLNFESDDDLWLYINNKLVLDLGGVHNKTAGRVRLDDFSLVRGQTYKYDLYYAERHTVESVLRIEIPGLSYKAVSGDNTYLFDSRVFNAKYYYDQYPDLQRAFGYNVEALKEHWKNYGLMEGRIAHPNFSVTHYLSRYKDLRDAFGKDYLKALKHYIVYGINEKRNASPN